MGVFDTSDGKFRVSADGQLAGSRQCSGVFEGQALSINQEGPIRILPCVVKKGNSKGLQRELSVLRRCRESGLPLRSGREEYFLGECIDSTPDEDSASSCCRSIVLLRGPPDLTQLFGESSSQPQGLRLACQVAIGTLEALRPLHAVGYLHANVHPRHILLDPD